MTGVTVTGGVDGIAAHVADLLALARVLDVGAGTVDDALHTLEAPTLGWTLVLAAPLDPAGIREVRDRLAALTNALQATSAELAALSFALLMTAQTYRDAEQRVGSSLLSRLADDIWSGFSPVPTPLLAQLLNVPEHELTPPAGLPRILATVLPDGSPVLHDLGEDPYVTIPPHALSDLVLDLETRNRGRPGEISVSFVTGADGRRRAIVDLPGTKSWNPAPGPDVTSVGTDVIAIAGRSTSYEQGVFAALADAGVGPHTEVMLVGHSEGGIVAVNAARDAAASGRFRITHVVTAGSPVGDLAGGLPSSVQLLALENTADVVPALDNAPNAELRNIVTVRAREQHGSIRANHSLEQSYQPEAVDAQTAGNGSIDAFLSGAHGFLSGATMTTHAYLITRAP
ncbi:MAG TPA: hypothetical protein VIG48_02540 [Jatrophihabitans sp.]